MIGKVLLFAVSAAILILGCQQQQQQPAVDIKAEETAISALLDSYVKSVENEDIAHYARNIVHDSNMVNFGGFGAPIVGWDGLMEVMQGQFDGLSDVSIDVSDVRIHVAPSGNWAWATSLWNFKSNTPDGSMELPVRCTWILEKQAGGWIIIHFHKSISAG